MMGFNFFGSVPKLNRLGRDRTNSKSKKTEEVGNAAGGETSEVKKNETNEEPKGIVAKTFEKIGTLSRRVQISEDGAMETKWYHENMTAKSVFEVSKLDIREDDKQGRVNMVSNGEKDENKTKEDINQVKKEDTQTGSEILVDEEIESRDKFEMEKTTFYKVLTKSFYEHNMNILRPFQKKDNTSELKSSTKRTKKTARTLKERKLIISSPQNFQRVEDEMTLLLKKEAEKMGFGTLKKSASMDDLLRDSDLSSDEDSTRLRSLDKGRLAFTSMRNLSFENDETPAGDETEKNRDESRVEHVSAKDSSVNGNAVIEEVEKVDDKMKAGQSEAKNSDSNELNLNTICLNCGYDHSIPVIQRRVEDGEHKEIKNVNFSGLSETSDSKNSDCAVSSNDSEEDIDKLVQEYIMSNLVTMRDKSRSTPELLKSINQYPKERIERSPENKFPLDDENVEVRRKPSIQRNRISKTTDFDLGRRRQDSPVNPKNFDIRGIVKFQIPNTNPTITKLNREYIAYENENFYRVNEKMKTKELLKQNILLKSARYLKSKESKEVELRDVQNVPYILYFDSIKYAKQFMENEKIQVYVTDNKVTIKKTLLRFLGKRTSREILEKKGIYKNEPIFGNTLRDIYMKGTTNSGSPVPMFIYKVIELIERPENIKSVGLYRTSGNLATIQEIRCKVDDGRLEILDKYSKDPDVLTGSLKLFFRELKEPLIPCEVCEKLMEITKLDLQKMSPKDHQKIKSTLVKNLHEANLETFYVVIRHLLEVAKYKEDNKMDTYNLAVCWGPSMIFSAHQENLTIEMSKDIVTQSHGAARLVDFLLGYYELYETELNGLSKRPDSLTEKLLFLKRQESRDSVQSSDSSKSQKKSSSNLSLSIDEITKKLVELIEPNLSTEGLYKTPGSLEKTNKLMKKLNKKKINELDKNKTDVYDMADTLKKYLREQDGLVHKETIELVLKATSDNSQNYLEPITRRKVTALIEETPKKDTLIFILRHLAKVVDHESRHKVSKKDIIAIWTDVLDYQRKCQVSYDEFNKFLTVAVEVFNDNLPDIVRSSFGNNNGGSPNRNEIMGQVVKQMKHQQEKERDRNSRYDNVDCDDAGEASILDAKTEQTKL